MPTSAPTPPPNGGGPVRIAARSLQATAAVLRWGVRFYVAHLPLLLVVSAGPVATRWAFVLWGERMGGTLVTPVEIVVLGFRLLLVLAVVAAARGEPASLRTYRAMLESETLEPALAEATERAAGQWPTVLLQFAFLALVFGGFNLAVAYLASEPVVAEALARAGVPHVDAGTAGQLAAFTLKNAVVIPLAVVCGYGVLARA